MARKYIQIYHDFTATADEMNDSDLANLVRAMLHYGQGDDPALYLQNEVVKLLFNGNFKGQIDRNAAFDAKRSKQMSALAVRSHTQHNSNLQPVTCNDNSNFLTVTQGGEKNHAEHRGDTDGDVRLGNETIL